MPYSGKYSLGIRCLSEFLATTLAVFMGDSVVANEVLPNTKGHSMGFLGVAIGFGIAFSSSITIFGGISAHVNPAATLTLFVIGSLDFVDFVCISLAQFAGAFVGAVLMFLTYWPHFRTIPELQCKEGTDLVSLRTRDEIGKSALRVCSYNTRSNANTKKNLRDHIKDMKYYLLKGNLTQDEQNKFLGPVAEINQGYESYLHKIGSTELGDEEAGRARRYSIQVAHMQRFLKQADKIAKTKLEQVSEHNELLVVDDAVCNAAIMADQGAKLQAFANRPAIYLPIHNFLVELISTTVLILGAFLLDKRFSRAEVYEFGLGTFFVGLWIQVGVLALGGPTGFAANPARDFGPRLAHFVLPIHGKGSSEWNYGLIVFLATFCGGLLAGGLYLGIIPIFENIIKIS